MTNQIFVQLSSKTPQNMLQHYLQDILDILKLTTLSLQMTLYLESKFLPKSQLKFLRFNYQLLWEQKDQRAYINFPQILTHIELLPYIIKNEKKTFTLQRSHII